MQAEVASHHRPTPLQLDCAVSDWQVPNHLCWRRQPEQVKVHLVPPAVPVRSRSISIIVVQDAALVGDRGGRHGILHEHHSEPGDLYGYDGPLQRNFQLGHVGQDQAVYAYIFHLFCDLLVAVSQSADAVLQGVPLVVVGQR